MFADRSKFQALIGARSRHCDGSQEGSPASVGVRRAA